MDKSLLLMIWMNMVKCDDDHWALLWDKLGLYGCSVGDDAL